MLDRTKLDQLLEILGDDAEGVGEIIDTFLDDVPGTLEELQAGLDDDDARRVASAAHKIKGSASTLGAVTLAEICKDLEEAADDGDLASVAQRMDELEETWEATEAALIDAHPAR